MKQKLNISIVIPVYNEGDGLRLCLNAIANLEQRAYEVIVVDNNSSDHSREIANSFDFVKLISEPKQGVVHARSCGFNEARGDIIARIDADTILYPSWTKQIEERFKLDPALSAISGPPDYYDFILRKLANWVDRRMRNFLAKALRQHLFLYGSNMAIRRSAWNQVKLMQCIESGIHEDLDLAIHLQLAGLRVEYDDSLVAGVSMRRFGNGFFSFIRYTLVSPRSYSRHSLAYGVYIYPVVIICWLLYAPAHLLILSYDQANNKLSWRNFLANRQRTSRVDPTANVA